MSSDKDVPRRCPPSGYAPAPVATYLELLDAVSERLYKLTGLTGTLSYMAGLAPDDFDEDLANALWAIDGLAQEARDLFQAMSGHLGKALAAEEAQEAA